MINALVARKIQLSFASQVMYFHCASRNQKTQLLLSQFTEFCEGDKELEERCPSPCSADVCSRELCLLHLGSRVVPALVLPLQHRASLENLWADAPWSLLEACLDSRGLHRVCQWSKKIIYHNPCLEPGRGETNGPRGWAMSWGNSPPQPAPTSSSHLAKVEEAFGALGLSHNFIWVNTQSFWLFFSYCKQIFYQIKSA